MRYQNVCLESFGYSLPDEIVTSSEIERRLAPLYERLRLPEGRLELMTGIRERRFWPVEMPPSVQSVISAERAIQSAGIDRGEIGALIHGSVCRDFLEPATACGVHHQLGLPANCLAFDVSNACLGLLTGAVQIANMIELGQIRAGIVVGTENGRSLVDSTIAQLNHDRSLKRNDIKLAVASLTIGSASCAMLLTHKDLSQTGNRLTAASALAHTTHHELCQGAHSNVIDGSSGMLMRTDSERLMQEGIVAGVETFLQLRKESGWLPEQMERTFCHQVGSAHRKLMLEALGLPPENDFTTLQWLGNTGSVALPITMALGLERGFVQPGQNVAMLGIGSGINCLMMTAQWQKTLPMPTISAATTPFTQAVSAAEPALPLA
jgi:3-oxoacyl-[acyl-carrier-protein] synthase-3